MITIQHTRETEDLIDIYTILSKNFKQYELVKQNDFIYYAQNYYKLYNNEDYITYKIQDNGLIGVCTGVILNELILIDYLAIKKEFRYNSKQIIYKLLDILNKYDRPIIIEAETEQLCRLYHMFGFIQFNNPYTYYTISDNKICSRNSNLLYSGKHEIDFNSVKDIIYKKYYLRWYSIYDSEIINEYNKIIMNDFTIHYNF